MGWSPSSLRDNFTDNSISVSAWVEGESGSAVAAETGGQIRFTLPSSTAGTHTARLTSRYTYDLTGDSFYINIETMVATGVAATAFFQFYIDASNALQWIQVSGTIYARKIIAGVSTDLFSAAWSSSTYKYLRIGESGGTLTWWSSTNGTSWTSRATLANPFAITDLYVDFGATCGNIASPGSFRLDDVNLILPALTTNWRWTNARRALVNRHKRTTLAIDTANTGQAYLITADGVDASDAPSGNVRYWSGPVGGARLLTEQADEASAQAMAVNIPLDGTFDLPQMIDARLFRLGHRSVDGNSYSLRNFYPRTLVRADDIEAEVIRALHIAANSITADRIYAAFTITGKNIQTAESGARVVLSGDTNGGLIGYGSSDTYSVSTGSGTYQILWSKADGKFYFGGGHGNLDSTGANFLASLASGSRYIRWGTTLGSSDVAAISGFDTGTYYELFLSARTGTGRPSRVVCEVNDALYQWILDDQNGKFYVYASTDLAVLDAGTNAASTVLTMRHNTSGTPAAGFGSDIALTLETTTTEDQSAATIRTVWVTATHASRKARMRFFVYDTAARTAMDLEASGSAAMIGFLGAAAVARQNITGVRTGTLAQLQTVVANLLTALATEGLITDSTT